MKKYEIKFRTISDGLAVLNKLFDTPEPMVDHFELRWCDCTLLINEEEEGRFQNIITSMFDEDMGILSCVLMDLLEE